MTITNVWYSTDHIRILFVQAGLGIVTVHVELGKLIIATIQS